MSDSGKKFLSLEGLATLWRYIMGAISKYCDEIFGCALVDVRVTEREETDEETGNVNMRFDLDKIYANGQKDFCSLPEFTKDGAGLIDRAAAEKMIEDVFLDVRGRDDTNLVVTRQWGDSVKTPFPRVGRDGHGLLDEKYGEALMQMANEPRVLFSGVLDLTGESPRWSSVRGAATPPKLISKGNTSYCFSMPEGLARTVDSLKTPVFVMAQLNDRGMTPAMSGRCDAPTDENPGGTLEIGWYDVLPQCAHVIIYHNFI